MLKQFLKEKEISIYRLAKESGVPYSTLNDIINYKVDIKNVRAGILYEVASVLEISMDELYGLCKKEIDIFCEEYSTKGKVSIRNKTYILEYLYRGEKYVKELHPVKQEATMFIDIIATWEMEKQIADLEMEAIYELCVKEKK